MFQHMHIRIAFSVQSCLMLHTRHQLDESSCQLRYTGYYFWMGRSVRSTYILSTDYSSFHKVWLPYDIRVNFRICLSISFNDSLHPVTRLIRYILCICVCIFVSYMYIYILLLIKNTHVTLAFILKVSLVKITEQLWSPHSHFPLFLAYSRSLIYSIFNRKNPTRIID